MSNALIAEINYLIAEGDIEQTDAEIFASLGKNGFPTLDEITKLQDLLNKHIISNRAKRLEAKKAAFKQHQVESSRKMRSSKKVSIADMIQGIAQAIQNPKAPEGLIVAFREQSTNKATSEEDITEIWKSFVQLGLIDIDENDDQ